MEKLSSSYRINLVKITEQRRLGGTSAGLQSPRVSNPPLEAGLVSNLDLFAQELILLSYENLQTQEIQQLLCLFSL